PFAHRPSPVHTIGGQIDLAEHDIDHAVEHVDLVPDMAVEGHRLDPELMAQLAHAERFDAVPIGEADGGPQDPLPRQGCAALCLSSSSQGHLSAGHLASSIHRKSRRAYGVCARLTA